MFSLGQAVGYLLLDTSSFSTGFSLANKQLGTLTSSTATLEQKFASLGAGLTTMGAQLTKYFTLPLIGIGVAAVKTGMEFDAAMSQVQAIAGATEDEFEELRQKAIDLGATTQFSASDAANALYYMSSAGWTTQQMLEGVTGVMQLAAAAGVDLATASDIVASGLNAFGLSASDAALFADVLAQASNKTNTDVVSLGEAFKYIAPLAGTLGFTIQDVAAALGLMSNAGIQGSQAGTTLRSAITNLIAPSKEASAAMEYLGISAVNQDGSMKSLREILEILRDKFSGLTESQQAQAASMIFGKEAMSGMLSIINSSEEDFDGLMDSMGDAEGAAEDMASIMTDNLKGSIDNFTSAIEGAAIKLSDALTPTVRKTIESLTSLVERFTNLSDEQVETGVKIAGVVAAVGPLLLIFGKLASAVGSIISIFSAASGAVGAAGGVLAALTGPIGIVIAIVAALALAWSTNLGNIREHTANIFGAIKELIQTVMAKIKEIWESNWMGIRSIVEGVIKYISVIIDTGMKVIENVIKLISSIIKGDWEGAWEAVKNIVSSAVTGVISIISGIGSTLFNVGKAIFTSLWNGIKSIWTNISTWVWDKVQWIADKLNPLNWFNGDDEKAVEAEAASRAALANSNDVEAWSSYASGLDYVPYDNYKANLHEGERVMTKEENEDYENGSRGNTEFNFYSPKALDPITSRQQFEHATRLRDMGFSLT